MVPFKGHVGIMEKNMETTGYRDNGKENGNYYNGVYKGYFISGYFTQNPNGAPIEPKSNPHK